MNLNNVTPQSEYAWFMSLVVGNKDGTSTTVYMQLQPQGIDANNNLVTTGIVNYSFFGATSATPATGSSSEAFSNESSGYRITHPLAVASGMAYTETITLANGVLTGTITNTQSGMTTQIGSFPAPNAVSILWGGYSWEYWGSVAFGSLPAGDVSFTNPTTNVAGYTLISQSYTNGNSALNDAGINYAQVLGAYNEVSTGGTANTVTLGGTYEVISGNGPTTLQLTSTYADLTTDSVSGIQTLDLQGNMATMTAAQYAGFTTFLHTTGGMAILLPGNLASYNVAKGASGGFVVSSSAMASTSFLLATKLIFADQTVTWSN